MVLGLLHSLGKPVWRLLLARVFYPQGCRPEGMTRPAQAGLESPVLPLPCLPQSFLSRPEESSMKWQGLEAATP